MSEEKKHLFFKTMLRAVPIQFKSAPWHGTTLFVGAAVDGLVLALSVVATQHLFDAITNAAIGDAGFWDCVIPLLVLAAVIFGRQITGAVQGFQRQVMFDKSQGKLSALLHKKLQRIDPACFENTDFLDDLNKAREGAKALPRFCHPIYFLLSLYGVYFATVGAYLFSLKPMLLLTIVIAFVPALLSHLVSAKIFAKLEKISAPLRRENEYYERTLCDREYFKETRILGAFTFFHKLFTNTMMLLTRKQWQAESKTAILQLSLNIVSFAGMAASTYMLFTATIAGEISVGAFAAVFAALGEIFNLMEDVIWSTLGNMSREIGKVANFVRVLDMPERVGAEGTSDFTKGIVAKNISFTYPGRDTPAVSNVSLSIANGETVAIVGENGAGKSTLVRLLTGIYHPTKGNVTVGGLDTAKTAPKSIYQGISGVFQKYQRYKMTLEENISISDTSKGTDLAGIETALKHADEELNIALNTMLSPEFDGIDLSGGQWQRVAIARGLYRTNSFIVLDEPTSAIDPIEETRIYTQFQQLAKNKCAVIVTHRLGSAKLAHRIVVMDRGEIVDTGTHNELLTRPGKYADMWTAQAQWYDRQICTTDKPPIKR